MEMKNWFMKSKNFLIGKFIPVTILLFCSYASTSQTEVDAIMMNRNQFCNGLLYNYSSWDKYWEGTIKRSNENIGTISTQSVMYMAAYGVTDKFNLMVGLPFVWTKASAGTLKGLKGVQDLSFFVKWKAVSTSIGKNKISLFALGGISTPVSDYVTDYLPLSIGLGSTNLMARAMFDYQRGRFTVTGSAAYVRRSNITIDRNSYYDTELHLTNEVKMPDAMQYQLRIGYRGKYLLAEAVLNNWTTRGGFDITRNNMPFPSNRMNATTLGVALKYTLPSHVNLSFLAGANYTLAGRNMGQASLYNVGAFYAFYFKKHKSNNSTN
jgi:hypothetical protein